MKIVTILGARPQFIKAAVVSRELQKKHKEIIVHTGQHFDYNMSKLFFDELDLPTPDYNLGISGGTHAQMVGRMMIAIEDVLQVERPDWVLVFGDTNSTLAAALTAAKLYIPICHVEAGARTHNMTNPEEINRICTDHVSTLLLPCTKSGYEELTKEGLKEKSEIVGDPMFDAFLKYSNKLKAQDITLDLLSGGKISIPDKFYYLTCHREENTHDDKTLKEIFEAVETLDFPTIYPVHPRNKERALRLKQLNNYKKVLLTEPVGYLESTCLVNNSIKVITDSGGLQREAFFAGKKCVTLLDFVCWPETMVDNRNELSKPVASDIIEKINHTQKINSNYQPFGDGNASHKIVAAIERCAEERMTR